MDAQAGLCLCCSQAHEDSFLASRPKNVSFITPKNFILNTITHAFMCNQSLQRLEKYLTLEGFLEKSVNIKSALKSTGKSIKSLEKSLNSTIFCRT